MWLIWLIGVEFGFSRISRNCSICNTSNIIHWILISCDDSLTLSLSFVIWLNRLILNNCLIQPALPVPPSSTSTQQQSAWIIDARVMVELFCCLTHCVNGSWLCKCALYKWQVLKCVKRVMWSREVVWCVFVFVSVRWSGYLWKPPTNKFDWFLSGKN